MTYFPAPLRLCCEGGVASAKALYLDAEAKLSRLLADGRSLKNRIVSSPNQAVTKWPRGLAQSRVICNEAAQKVADSGGQWSAVSDRWSVLIF